MTTISRLKKAINAYVKNDAKAAAVASFLMNKDCTSEELIKFEGISPAILGLLSSYDELEGDCNLISRSEVIKFLFLMNCNKPLFLLCGPSAVGKDTLASYAKELLYLRNIQLSYVNKYTTRHKRAYEGQNADSINAEPSGCYEYFSSKDEMLRNKQDSSLGYELYGKYYSFSGDHLLSVNEDDDNLLCIYGRLENIPAVKKDVFLKFRRIPFAILLNAPVEDLESRLLRRHTLSLSEQGGRIKEIKRQVSYLLSNLDAVSCGFDLVINNGDEIPVRNSCNQLADFLSNTILACNNIVKS